MGAATLVSNHVRFSCKLHKFHSLSKDTFRQGDELLLLGRANVHILSLNILPITVCNYNVCYLLYCYIICRSKISTQCGF